MGRITRPLVVSLLLTLLFASQPLPTATADGHVDAQQRREELRERRAAAAEDVDLLRASQAEVEAALDALAANAAAEQALLSDANRQVVQVADEATVARSLEQGKVQEVDLLKARLRDLAVDEFVGGASGLDDASLMLDAQNAGEATKIVYLAGLEVERQDQVADQLEEARQDLELQRAAAEAAEERAVEEQAKVAARVIQVEQARDEQARFVTQVEGELERSLAEAAALEQLDGALAAEIVRGERALADRLAAERARADAAALLRATRRVAPSSEAPRTVSAGGGMVSVRGIVVHRSIAGNLESLLSAADADGISFGGGGYRDPAQQRRLREQNCPDPERSPASSCRPPTARVGQSNHEDGLAIDFTYQGQTIPSQSSPAYRWLDANAGTYGLRNLPGEPWHWSTNGN